ncbi:MAG: hypothetical protein ACE5FJ_06030 [Gemmatimonadales bacterium]
MALALATQAAAQAASGTYTTSEMTEQTTEMEDGGMQQLVHYRFMMRADDSNVPLHNTGGDCVGLIRISAQGTPTGGSGSCFNGDGAGSGITMWWQVTEVGSADCPLLCGVWDVYDGYGRFEGVTGRGRWMQDADIGMASSGVWEGDLTS